MQNMTADLTELNAKSNQTYQRRNSPDCQSLNQCTSSPVRGSNTWRNLIRRPPF